MNIGCWYGCVQLEGNPELRDLFSKAGINENQLKNDKDMSKFVMEFLDERGGLEAVKREREREKARPPLPVPPSVPVPPNQPPPPPAVPHNTLSSRPPPPAGNAVEYAVLLLQLTDLDLTIRGRRVST